MFYTEEDIQPVVSAAIKVFGKQGQYHYFPSKVVNMLTISSNKYGKIWYGDVEKTSTEIFEGVKKLMKDTGEDLSVDIVQVIP